MLAVGLSSLPLDGCRRVGDIESCTDAPHAGQVSASAGTALVQAGQRRVIGGAFYHCACGQMKKISGQELARAPFRAARLFGLLWVVRWRAGLFTVWAGAHFET